MKRVWLVMMREIIAGATKKPFIITTAIMVLVMGGGAIALDYFIGKESADAQTYSVGVAASAADLAPALQATGEALGLDVETPDVADRAAAEAGFEDETIDAFLSGSPGDLDLLFPSQVDGTIEQLVTAAAQSLALGTEIAELGGDPAVVSAAIQGSAPTISFATDLSAMEGPDYLVAMLSTSLLLFALINSGSQIAMGVLEEKTSRVVELLLATLKPTQLFAGKVFGNGVLGLGQVAAYGLAFFAGATAVDLFAGFELDLGRQAAWVLLWFLLGFAIYAVLWGSLASLVSRQEDIGTVTAPVTILMLAPFYLATFLVPTDPDGTATRVLSMIPFFAPFMMPMRTALTDVPPMEMAIAVGGCLVLLPFLVWGAARMYQRGVMHTGGKMSVRQALRRG